MGALVLAVGCGEDAEPAVTRDAGHEAAHSGWGGPCALDPDSGGVVEPYCDLYGKDGRQMKCVDRSGVLTCLPECDDPYGANYCADAGGSCYAGLCLPGADAG